MSMRIGVQTDAGVANNARPAEAKSTESTHSIGYMPVSSLGTDEVSLSSASGLTSLSKTLMSASKQAKIAALTSQVRSGQYRTDAAQVSRSIIQSRLGM